jgi:hypothetical protein
MAHERWRRNWGQRPAIIAGRAGLVGRVDRLICGEPTEPKARSEAGTMLTELGPHVAAPRPEVLL